MLQKQQQQQGERGKNCRPINRKMTNQMKQLTHSVERYEFRLIVKANRIIFTIQTYQYDCPMEM